MQRMFNLSRAARMQQDKPWAPCTVGHADGVPRQSTHSPHHTGLGALRVTLRVTLTVQAFLDQHVASAAQRYTAQAPGMLYTDGRPHMMMMMMTTHHRTSSSCLSSPTTSCTSALSRSGASFTYCLNRRCRSCSLYSRPSTTSCGSGAGAVQVQARDIHRWPPWARTAAGLHPCRDAPIPSVHCLCLLKARLHIHSISRPAGST